METSKAETGSSKIINLGFNTRARAKPILCLCPPENGFKMINARAETLDKKPAFKKLLSHRRCLIPAH